MFDEQGHDLLCPRWQTGEEKGSDLCRCAFIDMVRDNERERLHMGELVPMAEE